MSHELVLDHLSGCATNFSIAMLMKTPKTYELVCYGLSTVIAGRLFPLNFAPEFQPHALYSESLKVRKYSLIITPAIVKRHCVFYVLRTANLYIKLICFIPPPHIYLVQI